MHLTNDISTQSAAHKPTRTVRLLRSPSSSTMSPSSFEGEITLLCTTFRHALRLPGHESESGGYTPVGKFEFTYTASHTFDACDSHDGACGFYAFLLGTLRSSDVTAMVRDQIGLELEELVMRMRPPPFVMYLELWFRDNFSDRERDVGEQFDECLLVGSLYSALNPGMCGWFHSVPNGCTSSTQLWLSISVTAGCVALSLLSLWLRKPPVGTLFHVQYISRLPIFFPSRASS